MVKRYLAYLFVLAMLLGSFLPFAQPVYALTVTLTADGEGTDIGGSYSGGAVNYTNINFPDDGDTSIWLVAGYALEYHSWTWTNPGLPLGSTINSVTIYWKCATYSGSNMNSVSYYRTGGNRYYSDSGVVGGTYTTFSKTWATNPSTLSAWTESQVNSAEFGVVGQLIGTPGDTVKYTYVYVVVDYTASTSPTVTTSAASSMACTTATLNGNVTSDGGNTDNVTVTVYWGDNDGGTTPGSWDNSSVPTSPAQPQGVAAFYKNATGLAEGTIFYFSAKATNSVGTSWGTTKSFTTWKDPVITTVAATNITVSSARLQAYLVDGGGTTCQVRFGWGSIDKGTDIDAYNGVGSPSAFAGTYTIGQSPYLDVDNLVSDNTTYFNVQAQNVCGSDNGTSTSFPTGSGVGNPSNVTAIPGYDNVVLSWTKGAGAPNTWVRFRANACPADETDGALIYVATGSTYTHTGLVSGIDYCYLLVGYDPVLLYSDNYTIIHATTLAAGSMIGTAGTAISNPSSMTQTPSVSATLEDNIPIFPFIRGVSTSTGIPMGSVTYILLLIILAGLSYFIYRGTHSIEAIVIIWVFASWVAYPTLHIPAIVPIFVSILGIGYGIYRIRSIV